MGRTCLVVPVSTVKVLPCPKHTLVLSITGAPAPGWGGEAVGTRDSECGTWFLIPGFEEMCLIFFIIFLFNYLLGWVSRGVFIIKQILAFKIWI